MHILPSFDRLYDRSKAARWNVTRDLFRAALARSVAHRFGETPPGDPALQRYLDSLHLEDLALACACAMGTNEAWEQFINTHRPALYRAAVAIAGESGRELADSLYAELFGLDERDGQRRSRFDYFHGRSSLVTWVRAILAQRHVDAIRVSRRTEPLDERPAAQIAAVESGIPDLDRPRLARLLQRSFSAALGTLEPADHLRLAYYYRDRLTLAEIGRLERTHEATVSRKLGRARRALRADVERRLREDEGLSRAEIDLAFQYAGDAIDAPDDGAAPVRGARRQSSAVQEETGSYTTEQGREP